MSDSELQDYQLDDLSFPTVTKQSTLGSLKSFLVKHRMKISGLIIFIVLFLVITCVVSIMIPEFIHKAHSHDDDDDDDNNQAFHEDNVLYDGVVGNTIEFQIALANITDFSNRAHQMNQWMEHLEENSHYFNLEDSNLEEATRLQHYIKTSGSARCGVSYSFRLREYLTGDFVGTTIDVKESASADDDDYADICVFPFEPVDKYPSSQKCERDEHECSHKYSRESRLFFEGDLPALETCDDMVNLFPLSMPKLDKEDRNNLVDHTSKQNWFVAEYSGVMDEDTKYKAAFTLKYSDFEDESPKSGEWSIRIYSKLDGASEEWNNDVVEDVRSAWYSVIDRYGNEDDDCE